MSALERRPNGNLGSGVTNKDWALQKGTYGRHTALRNGDCFRGLVNRCESRKGKSRNPTRAEGLRRHVTFGRPWGGRGVQENGLAGRIRVMSASGFVFDVVVRPH